MSWIEKKLNNILVTLLNVSLIILTVCTFLQVVSRFFNFSVPWSTDIIRITFIYVIFLAMPVLISMRDHITIDIFISILPSKVRRYFEILILVFILFFSVILFYSGVKFMLSSGSQYMPYIRVTMLYVYAVIPFSSLLAIFYTAILLGREVNQLRLKSD